MKTETAALIFKVIVYVLCISYLVDVSFRLMSTRSTLENLLGFLFFIIVALGACLLLKSNKKEHGK